MKYLEANEIPQVEVKCKADVFENAVRTIGVGFACEWFDLEKDSDAVRLVRDVLCERSGIVVLGNF